MNCSVDHCAGRREARGLCPKHYARLRKHGDPLGGGPDRKSKSSKPCDFEGCNSAPRARGLCYRHYKQWEYRGFDEERRPVPKAVAKRTNEDGYVRWYEPGHPAANPSGVVLEHRALMAERLGRPLLRTENVHHINGVRSDNRPDNLELWVTSQPSGQRPEDLLAWAHEIIALYGTPPGTS